MKYFKLLPLFLFSMLFLTANAQAPSMVAAAGGDEEVSVVRARLMVRNGALMVDVREQAEVDALAYDVENIIVVPVSEFNTRMDEIPREGEVIIVCRSGNRSRRVANALLAEGYTNIVNMTGGMNAWQAGNLAVITPEGSAPKTSCAGATKASCAPGTASRGCCASKRGASSCASKATTTEEKDSDDNEGGL